MKLIIGLGNPGKKYEKTWHNLGFLAVENLQKEFSFEKFKNNKKLQAEIAIGKIGYEKIILAKPQTLMNNSGIAVATLTKYYKIPLESIIVIHDDIDLPLGTIRIVRNSSAGGHNGVKSIIEKLKSPDFIRLKIGVKTSRLKKVPAPDYVLEKFNPPAGGQSKKVKEVIKKTASVVETIISDSLNKAMNDFN